MTSQSKTVLFFSLHVGNMVFSIFLDLYYVFMSRRRRSFLGTRPGVVVLYLSGTVLV